MHLDTEGRLLAWSLVNEWNVSTVEAMFYTRRSCRRLGYGTRLIRKIRKDFPRRTLQVFRWNAVSDSFFDAVAA